MIGDLLVIIIMLLIALIGIFKDYFFKDQTPRWVVILLIVASVSVAAFQARAENGKPMISAIIRNEEGSIIAKIDGNQWNINPNLMLDRNFDNKAVEVIDEEGKVVLQAILEEDGIRFAGIFYRNDGWKYAIGENIIEWRPPEANLETSFEPIFKYPSQLHPGERMH